VSRRRKRPATIEEMHAAAVAAGDAFEPPRRVYASWRRAMTNARGYAGTSGWKHRVCRVRGGFFVVAKTDRRVDWGPPWAKPLGAVRMTIDLGGNRE
jgi:hypothetical protein